MPRARVGDLDIAYDVTGQGDPVLMINGIGAPRGAWGLQIPAVSERYTAISVINVSSDSSNVERPVLNSSSISSRRR